MNGPRKRRRSDRISGGREGAQFHGRGREAWTIAIGPQPDRPKPRGTARSEVTEPHDPKRGADPGGRSPAPEHRAEIRGDGRRDRGAGRTARETGRQHPDHGDGARRRSGPAARLGEDSAELPGHHGGSHRRLRARQHRRAALRRRHPPRRARREGYDRGSGQSGLADGGRRGSVIFRRPKTAANASGSYRPQLPEPAPTYPRRAIRLGIREGRACAERAGGRPACLQRRGTFVAGCPERLRPRLPNGASRAALRLRWQARSGAVGLVPAVFRLPPLPSEPTPAFTGIFFAGGCTPVPRAMTPISGGKAHQTGCLNSHWLIIMPTMRLEAADKDYAIVGALPVDDLAFKPRRYRP